MQLSIRSQCSQCSQITATQVISVAGRQDLFVCGSCQWKNERYREWSNQIYAIKAKS